MVASPARSDTISSYGPWQWNGFTRTMPSSSSDAPSFSSFFSSSASSPSLTSTTSGASLSGTVYYDVNGDGIRESTDWAIRYAEVSLSLAGSTVTSTYTTGKDGTYTFAGLAAGDYTLTLLTTSNSGGTTSAGTGAANTAVDPIVTGASAISNIELVVTSNAVNFDFAQDAYPISLISKRLLMGNNPGIENTVTAVPEPNTLALLAVAGLSLVGFARWRRLRNLRPTT
jgi:hypothetical protein